MQSAFILILLIMAGVEGMAQPYLQEFALRQKTKYFDFRFKRNPEVVVEIAKFADAFIGVVNRDFFEAKFEYPILVLVLEDRPLFQTFLREKLGVGSPPNFGIYFPLAKMFVTYEGSGLGTFAHEIMHPLVERNLKDRPLWALEGIPSFFEKFYGYWKDDGMVVEWGFQNPWRINALGPELVRLDLKSLLNTKDPQGKFKESDIRMVSMFLWEQGKFQRFLQLLQKRERNGYDSYFEAAMEKRVDEVTPIWENYLKTVSENRSKIMRLPGSVVLRDEAAFKKFAEPLGIKTER